MGLRALVRNTVHESDTGRHMGIGMATPLAKMIKWQQDCGFSMGIAVVCGEEGVVIEVVAGLNAKLRQWVNRPN